MKRSFGIVFFLMITVIGHNTIASTKQNDIRVVIDVSGSMKKTDPHNLRIPAMKMLNGLIPDSSYAGVWNFGRYVDMTVEWGTVDKEWRERADIGVAEIHSDGLYTNIEKAVATVTRGWEKVDVKTQRSLILLTDGQVDISKDEQTNENSRQMVLTKSLQKLKESGARVHAIALSKDADEILLRQLALETGGSFEIAHSANELQKIFLKMFERATDPDTIELDGNQFTVDKSITEMTLLIFRPKGSNPTLLHPPDSPLISAYLKGKTIWRSEDGYDLITITKPKVGVWKIDAYSDPDNRLMVVTDLKLQVSDIPPYLTPAQAINITAELYNKNKRIYKNSFLRFVNFGLVHIDEEGAENQLKLTHSKIEKDKGQYLHSLAENLNEGKHSFVVTIDSRTFNRNKRIDFEVKWPVKVITMSTSEPGTYLLTIQAREEYLKSESLQPDVKIEAPDGEQQMLTLDNISGVWQAEVKTSQEGLYKALIKVSAESVSGEKESHDLGAFSMIGVYQATEDVPQLDVDEVEDENFFSVETSLASPEEESGWTRIMIIVGLPSLMLILVIGGAFFMVRRSANKGEFSLEDDMLD
jgi:uncharacterized protein (TIGR03503 family)